MQPAFRRINYEPDETRPNAAHKTCDTNGQAHQTVQRKCAKEFAGETVSSKLNRFDTLLRGRLIGRTPDFESGYHGSSPCPGANLHDFASWGGMPPTLRFPR